MKPRNIAAVAAFLILIGGCTDKQQVGVSGRNGTPEASEMQSQRVLEFAQKHAAITNWAEALPRRDALGTPFSIDVARAMIKEAPILTEGYLEDISEKDGKFIGLFGGWPSQKGASVYQLMMQLQLTREQAAQLMREAPTNGLGRFALIARFTDVRRPTKVVKTEGADVDNPEFEIEIATSDFQAKGVCVDFLQLQ